MLIAIVQALQTIWDPLLLVDELCKYRSQEVRSLLFLDIVEGEVEVCNGRSWLSGAVILGVLNDR
jgi:hypothetical protein